ncbi:MAG: GNAT family N-acetyltransferase [Clostridia bacterium]|jgi:predicted acetyltransferase
MKFEIHKQHEDAYYSVENMKVKTEDDIFMSQATISTLKSMYCGNLLKTMIIGGVETEPEYRRNGCVREIFNNILPQAPERGWVVSFLHPFSFSYYRKFGYEKVADQLIIEFPINKLSHIPRCNDFKLLRGEDGLSDAIEVYNKFTEKRNIMFYRYNDRHFFTNPSKTQGSTYIWYDEKGTPSSYISLAVENYYSINRMVSVNLNVYEMAFTTPESLIALFGFIRLYEGENDTVKIHNAAMSPEIDLILRNYTHTTYRKYPDLMARVLNVKKILEANSYPKEKGHFRVKVNDTLDFTQGVWEVEFENGTAVASRINDTTQYDLSADMPAFSQLVYGYDAYTIDTAAYMEGVKILNPNTDFFRAFSKKNNGLFEHF